MKIVPVRQQGASMVELLIALPMFVMLILIIAELGLMYQAKSIVDVAALSAARAGAIHNGDAGNMRNAAILALSPLYTKEASTGGLIQGAAKSLLDANLPHAIGSTTLTQVPFGPLINGAPGGVQQGVKVEILSPTKAMVADWGVRRTYYSGSSSGSSSSSSGSSGFLFSFGSSSNSSSRTDFVIPNDNLMYRSTAVGANSGANVQDANLLKIRLTYLYELKMPLTRYFFTPFMDADMVLHSPSNTADLGFRVPLVAYATVRMQSDFKEASLSAAASDTGGGGSSSGGTGGTSTPTTPITPEPDPEPEPPTPPEPGADCPALQ